MLQVRRQVYFDNNATTSVAPKVARAMWRVLRHCHCNPSSPYRVGRAAAAVLEDSRQRVAATIGARPQEVLFTGSASEANNQVLLSCAGLTGAGRTTIVSTPIEHPSILATLASLRATGIKVRFCPVDAQGLVVFEALRALVDSSTLLVCAMLANNEIGTIQDVRAIADLAHRQGALVMSDCVQALGKIPLDVKARGVDFASFSAHKIHGPKGVGVLYANQGRGLLPLIHGGHQEGGLRAGTESLHNIAGLATACDEGRRLLAGAGQVVRLKGLLVEGIRTLLPTVLVNSPAVACLPNTLSVTLSGFDSAEAIAFLDYQGIAVSAGSACNTQSWVLFRDGNAESRGAREARGAHGGAGI